MKSEKVGQKDSPVGMALHALHVANLGSPAPYLFPQVQQEWSLLGVPLFKKKRKVKIFLFYL